MKSGKISVLYPEDVISLRIIENISVPEHYGTWYTIDSIVYKDTVYFLLEHEEYGDETPNIIIDQNGRLILKEVFNGFEDLADFWEDWSFLED